MYLTNLMALVCLCHGINERRVRREIEHGATSIEEVAERCGAGSCCHGCHPTIDALLADPSGLPGRTREVGSGVGAVVGNDEYLKAIGRPIESAQARDDAFDGRGLVMCGNDDVESQQSRGARRSPRCAR